MLGKAFRCLSIIVAIQFMGITEALRPTVEGAYVRFLKHRQDIQSKEDWDILKSYINSTPPVFEGRTPHRVSASRRKKKTE